MGLIEVRDKRTSIFYLLENVLLCANYSRKIEEMCSCIELLEEDLKKQFLEQNSKIKDDDIKDITTGREGYVFSTRSARLYAKIEIEYQGYKTNGEPKKNLSKEKQSILFNYCPFCGLPTELEEPTINENADRASISVKSSDSGINLGFIGSTEYLLLGFKALVQKLALKTSIEDVKENFEEALK